jgi:hypothetical protein
MDQAAREGEARFAAYVDCLARRRHAIALEYTQPSFGDRHDPHVGSELRRRITELRIAATLHSIPTYVLLSGISSVEIFLLG